MCIAVLLACALLIQADRSSAATSASYGNVVFSDGFESGSLSAWNGYAGTGTGTVVAAAAHAGTSGLRLNNASGQFGLVQKALANPLVDSSTKFWVRFGAGTGLREVAEARDQASSATMWALLYDGGSHALWFYPFRGSSSTEIFTGANSVPANTWTQIEVQYKATATGGAALLINGQTQAAWSVSGDYTRSTNLQRLQLWDDAADTSDFDDVTIATPSNHCDGAGVRRRVSPVWPAMPRWRSPGPRRPPTGAARSRAIASRRTSARPRRRRSTPGPRARAARSPVSRTAPRTRSRWRPRMP